MCCHPLIARSKPLLIATLLLTVCGAQIGCGNSEAKTSTKTKPAKVEPHPSEADIYRVLLTEKAEQRLGITTVPVERKAMPRTRLLGGEILVPDGHRIPITAPLTGKILNQNGTSFPVAGKNVKKDELLLELSPILPPERDVPNAVERIQIANAKASLITAQIQANGDVQQAKAQVDATKIAFDRAKKLLEDKAGSQRAADDAEAAYIIAQKQLEAAEERKATLDKLTLDADEGSIPIVKITSPQSGIIQTVSARIDQVVTAGTPLFEIVDLSKMWVRVPTYAGLVSQLATDRDAAVSGLSNTDGQFPATPIDAPPSADPLSFSVDLYFEIDNKNGRFSPRERVSVYVPMQGEEDSLVIPRAAVLWDIFGTSWVYVKSGEHEFRRERVSITFTTGELAVLSSGPKIGTPVVVDGAAELFGTEFGAGK